MALAIKSIYTWLTCAISIIFVALKLDGVLDWNWFYVLIPLWIYDTLLLVHVVVQTAAGSCREYGLGWMFVSNGVIEVLSVVMMIAFKVLLCLRLQFFLRLPIYYVFIPLWIWLGYVIFSLISHIYITETTVARDPRHLPISTFN